MAGIWTRGMDSRARTLALVTLRGSASSWARAGSARASARAAIAVRTGFDNEREGGMVDSSGSTAVNRSRSDGSSRSVARLPPFSIQEIG
jgi:hypothetical protein